MRTARPAWLLLLATAAVLACIDPQDRRPGLALTGPDAEEIPSSWAFTNDIPEIALQVQTPYLIPHSVTVWCAELDGRLFVGAIRPETKRWPGWVERNPEVRIKVDGRRYAAKLRRIEDPEEAARVRDAYALKYELPSESADRPARFHFWQAETTSSSG